MEQLFSTVSSSFSESRLFRIVMIGDWQRKFHVTFSANHREKQLWFARLVFPRLTPQ